MNHPASKRGRTYNHGFDNYGRPCTKENEPPEYKFTEDECEHKYCTEYLAGYICEGCGKWFSYEEDSTGIHKERLQERIKIWEDYKEFLKEVGIRK